MDTNRWPLRITMENIALTPSVAINYPWEH